MKISLVTRGLVLLAMGILVAGCASQESVAKRGKFGAESCKKNERVAVDSKAFYAIYLDEAGEPVGSGPLGVAEEMTGTHANMMCPTPSGDPGVCPTGYCPKVKLGKTYCLRC